MAISHVVKGDKRALAHVEAGEEVEVEIEPDTEPREVSVPSDFLEALGQEIDARSFFESLPYSNKQRIVLSIEGAKTTETRQRRIAKAVENLREKNV